MKINLPEFIKNLFNNLSSTDESVGNNLNKKERVKSHPDMPLPREKSANFERSVLQPKNTDFANCTGRIKLHKNGFISPKDCCRSSSRKNVWDMMHLFSPSPKSSFKSLTIDHFPSPCSSHVLSPIFGTQGIHSNSGRNDIKNGAFVTQGPETIASQTSQFQRNPSILATPMVLSSLNSLNSGQTPADAFPDILQLIEQDCMSIEDTAKSKCCSDMVQADTSQLRINTNSSYTPTLPISDAGLQSSDDLDFVEMLISVADQVESEKTQPRKKFTYTRQEDKLRSRERGLRKCQHAKRMTDEENNYWKKVKRESRLDNRERKKEKLQPKEGVRKSVRSKKLIRYF